MRSAAKRREPRSRPPALVPVLVTRAQIPIVGKFGPIPQYSAGELFRCCRPPLADVRAGSLACSRGLQGKPCRLPSWGRRPERLEGASPSYTPWVGKARGRLDTRSLCRGLGTTLKTVLALFCCPQGPQAGRSALCALARLWTCGQPREGAMRHEKRKPLSRGGLDKGYLNAVILNLGSQRQHDDSIHYAQLRVCLNQPERYCP